MCCHDQQGRHAHCTRRSRDIDKPRTASGSYRHEALLWRSPDDYLATTVPFIHDGVAAGQSVMVAVTREHQEWLHEALNTDAHDVLFVDMGELGRNPARIIPAWRDFLDQHAAQGQPVRGIGEPIWVGRRPEEIAESQLHEALLNVAVEPDTPFWLICPYDAERLDPAVIEESYRSHPAVVDRGSYRGSHAYGGRDHVELVFGSPLPALAGASEDLVVRTRDDLQHVGQFVARHAFAAGAGADAAADLAVAVHELASGSLQRGAPRATVRCWRPSDAVVFEVFDEALVKDPMTGRKALNAQRKGLWAAHQLCDLVQLRSGVDGTTVRVHHWL